jgi:putative ABC transport system permease protein
VFSEAAAITRINLKSIPQRWSSSIVIVVGLAGVVAVFCALLALTEGVRTTLHATGQPDNVIVLRAGSSAELNSGLSRDDVTLIRQAPGLRRNAEGRPLASGEIIVITELLKRGESSGGANITLRGVDPATAFALRPQLRVSAGRRFTPGLRELLVGRGLTREFQGAAIGQTIRTRGSVWTIVGIFDSGDAHESELWADVDVAQSTFGRTGFSSVLAELDASSGARREFQDHLTSDPRLNVDVQSESDYFDSQTKQFRTTIGFVAGVVTFIMGLGAIFAALNTMYAAVAARSREIATLRAIGFAGSSVLVSVMIESLVLALAGGVTGVLIAYLLFNGFTVSTLSDNFTQIVFSFRLTPALIGRGLLIAIVIGMIGGFLPALRAARLPITTALRAL